MPDLGIFKHDNAKSQRYARRETRRIPRIFDGLVAGQSHCQLAFGSMLAPELHASDIVRDSVSPQHWHIVQRFLLPIPIQARVIMAQGCLISQGNLLLYHVRTDRVRKGTLPQRSKVN